MKKDSFTLAEFLVAISIIIIIAGIVVIRMDKSKDIAKDAQRVKDLETIANALENYYLKNNAYPSNLNSLTPSFLGSVPNDPDNRSSYVYTYCVESNSQKYILMAKLKTKSQALETDYDGGSLGNCNCPSDEPGPPYTYCIKSP
jgi:type II secretory pathway pseudopilin PulG